MISKPFKARTVSMQVSTSTVCDNSTRTKGFIFVVAFGASRVSPAREEKAVRNAGTRVTGRR